MVKRLLSVVVLILSVITISAQDDKPQIPNGDFETWTYDGVNLPNNWNSFQTAAGTYATMSYSKSNRQVRQSTNVRPGSKGQYSCVIWARVPIGTIVAQGNLTTGRVNAGAMTADNVANYNFSDRATINTNNGVQNPCAMKFTGYPDSIKLWVRFVPAGVVEGYETAKFSAIIHDDYDYIAYGLDSNDTEENKSHVVAKAVVQIESKDNKWQCITLPFNYTKNKIAAKYIQLNASTNAYPGKGTKNDSLYIDDIELVYNQKVQLYTLTYMVNDKVYHTEKHEAGDIITPIDEPVRGGYEFSGWSEIPKVMPENDVTVTGTFTKLSVDINLAATNVVTSAKYPTKKPTLPVEPKREYAGEQIADGMECYMYNIGADGYLNDDNGVDQEPTVRWTLTRNSNGTYIFKSENDKYVRFWASGFLSATPNYASNQTESSNHTVAESKTTNNTYKITSSYTWGTRYFGVTTGKVEPKQTADNTTDWALVLGDYKQKDKELAEKYAQDLIAYEKAMQAYNDSMLVYNDSIAAYWNSFAKHYNDTIAKNFAWDVTKKFLKTSDLSDNSVWATNMVALVRDQHWSGDPSVPYYEQSSDQWEANQWSVYATQTVNLPVGHYVLSVICRASAEVDANISVEGGDVLLSEAIPTLGDTGRGIDINGKANYGDGEYCNDGAGRGWERRFITFEVVGGTIPVKISVNGSADSRYQWMSVCNLELRQVPVPTIQNLAAAIDKLPKGTKSKADVRNMLNRMLFIK